MSNAHIANYKIIFHQPSQIGESGYSCHLQVVKRMGLGVCLQFS